MKGILVNYEYCTGCHSCEVACKKILNLPEGEFGIKLTEILPHAYEGKSGTEKWEEDGRQDPLGASDHEELAGERVRGLAGRVALPGPAQECMPRSCGGKGGGNVFQASELGVEQNVPGMRRGKRRDGAGVPQVRA